MYKEANEQLNEHIDLNNVIKIRDNNTIYYIGTIESTKDGIDHDYIKVRRCFNNGHINGICRISIKSPKYIVGYDENIKLPNNIKERLIEELNKPMKYKSVKDKDFPRSKVINGTKWDNIINEISLDKMRVTGNRNNYYNITKIPDYTKLEE